jgi:hypothetical protein
MALSQFFRSKDAEEPAPVGAKSCSHDAAIHGLAAEIRRLTARIDGLHRAFTALDSFRVALEAKTWIAFHRRRSGQVAGGCGRAASAKRDERGRYLPDLPRTTAAGVRNPAGNQGGSK